MIRDIMVLGDAPGPNTDGTRPLYPHTTTGSAARLIELMGISQEEYLSRTIRRNVNHDGSEHLSPDDAARRIKGLLGGIGDDTLTIVIGRRAADRHPELKGAGWGDVLDVNGQKVVVIPHTSGRNRYWNDKGNKSRIALILRQEIAKLVP